MTKLPNSLTVAAVIVEVSGPFRMDVFLIIEDILMRQELSWWLILCAMML